MKKAIFVGKQHQTDTVYAGGTLTELLRELDFPFGDRTFSKEELAEHKAEFQDVSFLFSTWGMPVLTEEEIADYFPALECLFYGAGSVQDFARPFLNRGIAVFSAWAANGVPVAEYSTAEIILASKGFFTRLHIPASGGMLDDSWKSIFPGDCPGNYDITVGIIGAGMIGKMVIQRLQRILEHLRILVFDPFLPQEKAEELGVTLCDLPTLFAESDVISNHLANNEQTQGMLDHNCFDRMKPRAVFINTGRGAQVVEADLIRALKEVPTRAAALDVTFPEPPVAGSEFYDMKNVFITPHIAGSLGNEVRRMGSYMLEEYRLYRDGKPTRYHVTLKMLETMA